jgi:hypothetical protein
MQTKLPILCPSCSNGLSVTQLTCSNCNTVVSGNYPLHKILLLNGEEQNFVLEFLLSSGSLKEMATKMGNSYPTVRNKLDDIISKLNNF